MTSVMYIFLGYCLVNGKFYYNVIQLMQNLLYTFVDVPEKVGSC